MPSRRTNRALCFARSLAAGLTTILLSACASHSGPGGAPGDSATGRAGSAHHAPGPPPNIVLIVTDDLGYGELGCYGQKLIRTPNLDALAAQGVRFTNAYSGSPVCAPSRCTLLTGLHTGHAAIRDNKEITPEGQEPLPESSVTIAQSLRARGYATAAIGKWGLGPPGSTGDPSRHGFDSFFGYMCQRHAHNHCPPFLYRNSERFTLPGNRSAYESGDQLGAIYAPDLMREEALKFVDDHAAAPFFLLFATPVPHMAMQVPEESIAEYRGTMEEKGYTGKSYLPHPEPHAAYAAMVTRMDRDVGTLIARLRERCKDRDTLVIFTSDNGPTINVGGADSTFFNSTAGLRGRKMDLYEGGIRVPLIATWIGATRIGGLSGRANGESSVPVASWDLFPTIASLCGASAPSNLDGLDLSPIIDGRSDLPNREYLYWEYPAGKGWRAARIGDMKAVRRNAKAKPPGPIEVYDLSKDEAETKDLAPSRPDIVRRAEEIFAARTPSPLPEWNYD
ncbi:MAG: arylsulfatase [Phycisphaerae bacterium]|nr:arylsulfatase [Phycisphaerae bacterium]